MKNKKLLTPLFILTACLVVSGCTGGNEHDSSSIESSENSSFISSEESSSTSDSLPNENEDIDLRHYSTLPYLKVNDDQKLMMALSISDILRIDFKTEESCQDDSIIEIKVNNKESVVKNIKNEETNLSFSLYDVTLEDIEKEIVVEVISGTNVISFTSTLKTYLEKYIGSYTDNSYESNANKTLGISILNYAAKLQKLNNEEETAISNLTFEQLNLLFNSKSQNIYNTDWVARDYISIQGEVENFTWNNFSTEGFSYTPIANFKTPSVDLVFSVTGNSYNNLTSKIIVGENIYEGEVVLLEETNETFRYKVSAPVLSPLNYSDSMQFKVYSNGILIDSVATYSLTRAIARMDYFGTSVEQELSSALYSYAKSLTWYSSSEAMTYEYLPPINDSGIYVGQIGEYSYDDSRMLVGKQFDTFGHYVYTTNGVVDSTSDRQVYESENYKLEYISNNDYRLTLNGGTLDGIIANHNANLEIVVTEDTNINGLLYKSWEDKNSKSSGAINTIGNVKITSVDNAKLKINGNVMIKGELSLENANVSINATNQTAKDYGVDVSGVVNIVDSNLEVKGFDTALYLNEGAEVQPSIQKVIVDGNSNVKLEATSFGINSHTLNKDLEFLKGNIEISANLGIKYGNVTLDEADVKILGGTVGIEEASPVTIKTISGDYTKGKLTVISKGEYNPYWGGNYAAKVTTMDVNGGTLSFEACCKDGTLITNSGSVWTFANSDVYIKSQDQLSHGIGANAGGETLTIENTARVFVEKCSIAIGCWTQDPIKVYVRGDFASINCAFAVGQMDTTTKVEEGFIR